MNNQQESSALKAAIIYSLVSNNQEIKELELSLKLLETNLRSTKKYPIIVFHDGLDERDIDRICKSFSLNVLFKSIEDKRHLFDDDSSMMQQNLSENCCNILSTKAHMHPALDNYEYVMCLDPDSYVIGKIKYDLFVLMQNHGYVYATINALKHKKSSKYDSCKRTKDYIENKNIKPTFFDELLSDLKENEEICNSGLDILRLDFWKSADFENYSDFICSPKEPDNYEPFIPLLAASVYLQKEKVHFFKNLPYWHRGLINNFPLDIHYRTKLAIKKMKFVKFWSQFSEKLTLIRKRDPATNPSEISVFDYKGFNLFYNKDGVRANLMKNKGWTYDEDITRIIISELKRSSHPLFIDIGAHLGFVTLNIVSEIEDVKIYAFEPGPFQNSLFQRTIKINGLEDKVTLIKEALSKETGKTSFYCQELPDGDWSMGNGLIDTKRGKGVQKSIKVAVETLDNWWIKEGKPCVDVLKIDTEGAELWIFQGGIEFLNSCKPTIILEIQPLNLHAYPYDAKDVFLWLSENNYRVETMDGLQITPLNFKDILRSNENFIARHRYQRSG